MKAQPHILFLGLVMLAGTLAPVPARAADGCLTCHAALGDAPSGLFRHDIHYRKGISCAGCHGGDPATDDMERAMSKAAGFIGVPRGDAISAACARCHADSVAMKRYGSSSPANELALLQTSVHGQLSINGRERIAQCISCHNAHGIVAVKDPASPVYPLNVVATCMRCHGNAAYIRSYNPALPVDQQAKYRTSVHGLRNARGDAKAAECANCHGSHNILPANDLNSRVYPVNLPATCASCHNDKVYMKEYGIPTDQYAKFARSVHGIALLQKHDLGAPACNSCHGNHGAAPPGVESISKVCGTCHALNADLFSASPHKEAFDERKLPECETCHGNHDIAPATSSLLGVTPEAVCSRCHTPQLSVKGYAAARAMRQVVDSLQAAGAEARALVQEAEQKGMEISETKYTLRDVHQTELEVRTIVHAFNEDRLRQTAEKGRVTAERAIADSKEALHEYVFRRIGLGIATLIITILAASLYLYLRRLDRAERTTPGKERSI